MYAAAKWQGKNSNLGQAPCIPNNLSQAYSRPWASQFPHTTRRYTRATQHSHPHTYPRRHTHSDVHAKEPRFPGDSASVWHAVVVPPVPAAFPGLAKLLHPLPPPEDWWKTVLKTTIPKQHLFSPPTCPARAHSLLGVVVLPRTLTSARPQHGADPEDLRGEGIPPPPGARRRSTPVCRRLRREEVRSKARPWPSQS